MLKPHKPIYQDHEEIVRKFARLIERIPKSVQEIEEKGDSASAFFEVKVSALNLIAMTAGNDSIYYREIAESPIQANPDILRGIINAAMVDFREGFMGDMKLLVSAEVFANLLVQAEVLLENDYKDAAAVIIRAVLEDALRRVCVSNDIDLRSCRGINDLKVALAKKNLLTAVQAKEIDAKKEIGNKAAHGRFDEYTKEDVLAFLEFVQRLLSRII